MAAKKDPKQILVLFNQIIKEASKTLGKPGYAINSAQFILIANGRLGMSSIAKLGTFVTVREYVCPSPNRTKEITAAVSCIERILKNAKTS